MRSTWELAKENIKHLTPCVHGGKVWEAEKKTNLNIKEIIDFSSSINPLGISSKALKAIKNNLNQLSIYPDSSSTLLREAIANRFKGISSKNVIIGNGSTELIYLFTEVFLEKDEKALIPTPTFGEYENAVRKTGGKPRHIKLCKPFHIEPKIFIREMKNAKITFLCNPNNPTGILVPHDLLIEIIEKAFEENVLIFLDENFLEFVDEEKQNSLISTINDYPNLLIIRSFTKFFGMTGLRVGYAIAPEDTIELMSNAKLPWNVNFLGQVAAIAGITDFEHLKKSHELIRRERAFLIHELSKIQCFKQYPTDANFILISIKESGLTSTQLTNKMLKMGILVRDCCSFRGLDQHHIRVAIKTRQDNEKLLEAFRKIVINNT